MNKINTAAVVGVGAIGSFFADKLDLALGESFKVIAGGERAERLKKDGLVINGRQRYFHIASPEQKGEFIDFIIIIPKMTGLKQALKDAENYIGPDTIIMTPLNGVEKLAGRKTEVDMFAGTIIKLGKETGVPTPFNEFLYHAIKVLEAKNEGTIVGV